MDRNASVSCFRDCQIAGRTAAMPCPVEKQMPATKAMIPDHMGPDRIGVVSSKPPPAFQPTLQPQKDVWSAAKYPSATRKVP